MRTITSVVLLGLVAGCAQTRTYRVSLKNQTEEPITVGMVKHGEPFERKWESPEQAAINGDKPPADMWRVIPPGRTGQTSDVKGKFRGNSEAVLRIYQGSLDLPEILATSEGQPNRIDIPLHPGLNRIVVTDTGGQFEATREERQPSSPVARQ